ncbi:hypothetical protein DBR23_22265 [Acidovorax sp. HMWF018]|uniref:TetR family transcriptional regulator n=1 Tax=Acidovorax sp. HMWF018 TaxID=2056855 RepID=UPI000D33B4BC|nr:TetR family transcriptional regulator [Acidovorax sp. HMWF018]PTT35907.1 hypothetical protein DBR23_22265 [Acidovorax sp. HMWF018]
MARKTRDEAQLTRNSILEAAERVYLEEGAGCSLQRIANEAQVTRGAIYWHFSSRGNLIKFIRLRLEGGWSITSFDAEFDICSNPLTNLRVISESLLLQASGDSKIQQIVRTSSKLVACSPRTINSYTSCMRREWLRAISLGMVREEIDLETAMLGLTIIINGSIKHWIDSKQSFDLISQGRSMVQAYLDGWQPSPIRSKVALRLAQQFVD